METQESQNKITSNKDKKVKEELGHFVKKCQGIIRTIVFKEKSYINHFKLHHKIIFAFLVFFGINLVWYGMWEIISKLPWIRNPVTAIVIGAIILIVTGYFYENLISTDFDKKNDDSL